ncbi:alpha/beta fold hydrolase [Duganella qianjiadongensis]|uniref:Alpha/beta fold hydrolase n=1 Tax=Duganella qianjiadongensis TaxID=2692176 RepID=A0ABW9VES5_9BURK|nr:alpha/beta fold hydrolase [Duganella qianjiadongensis]MYM37970.1 alpha/beta fold hydrolase [Duganella qianjiadongensis]
MNIKMERYTLGANDGGLIHLICWTGPVIKGVVQIVHGMAEHASRYAHVAAALVAAGYKVIASEHRGHGQAAFDDGSLGDFGPRGFQGLVDDMAVVTRHARASHFGIPLLMLAHSMGSMAAQVYLLEHGQLLDGCALSGTTALELLDPRRSGWSVESANATVGAAVTPVDWLSRDPQVPRDYIADPLCGFALTPASLCSIFDVGNCTAEPEQLARLRKDMPLYLFTGDHDPVNGMLAWFDPLVQRLRGAGLTDLSTHVYGGARHEVLNETNRDEVIGQLTGWLDRVCRLL